MYCSNCGKDAGENKFCPECGNPLMSEDKNPVPVQEKTQKKSKKGLIIIAVIVLAVIALIAGKGLSKGKNDSSSKTSTASSAESYKSAESKTDKKDDTENVKKTIANAKALAENGKYGDAIKLLKTITATNEVSSLIQEYADMYLKADNFGCYWTEDEMSDYHWAYAKGQDGDIHDFSFCVYIHQNKANKDEYGFHIYSSFTGYSGNTEWIFPNDMRIKGNNNEAIDFSGLNRKSEMSGRSMYEWVNFNISRSQFEELCKTVNESTEITVRFSGYTYHRDFTLTPKQIEGLKAIEKYGDAFFEVYGASD